MNLEDFNKFLNVPIISDNGVLTFVFTFISSENGNVNAHDNDLGVNIYANWQFVPIENEIFIAIQGFDIIKFDQKGLICKVENLTEELKCLESAYDLCFGS